MATIHMSEAEAANDFKALMDHVRAGSEVVIESGSRPLAIVRPTDFPRRTISESIRLLDASSERLSYTPVMDADFAADMREIISNRKPRNVLSVPD